MHKQFKEDIRSKPGDPIPHLIYADWLAENGYTFMSKVRRHIAHVLTTYRKYTHTSYFHDGTKYVYQNERNISTIYIVKKDGSFKVYKNRDDFDCQRFVTMGEWIEVV